MTTDDMPAEDTADPGRIAALRLRLAGLANKAESRFLSILRYSALAIAAGVLVAAAVFLALGLVRQIGPDTIHPEGVAVRSDDLQPGEKSVAAKPASVPSKSVISRQVRERTLTVYRKKFKSFQRPDTKITDQQVVDLIWSQERIASFNALNPAKLHDHEAKPLGSVEAVMLNALAAIDDAATKGSLQKQLAAYRNAKKANVCKDEVRYVSRVVESWNSYATNCPYWYESPIGCPSSRTISEPVVEQVCQMKFPDDLDAPAQVFASAVARYGELAASKIERARIEADLATATEHAKKLEGRANISLSGQLFFGFMAIMFLYLFIAMERHNRSLRALLAQTGVTER